ncbi:MAG: hypothetical protein IKD10_10195, partial [Lentisphaeria bacterium]|nr:hypothetical protein [Lentisphaeria bacterium]
MIVKFLLITALTALLLPLQALDDYSRQKLDRHFFAALNPAALPEEYAQKLARKDKSGALKAAVKYFRSRPAPKSLQSLQSKKGNIQSARNAAKGLVSSIRIEHQFPDGRIDFLYNPTGKNGLAYNPEWQWQLNRMHFWGNMAVVYRQTGDEELAGAFQQQLRDWLTNCPMPERNWNARGSAWRTIETGIRLMGNWQTAFELFRKSASISDETLALMLGSMHEQALHAFEHRTGQNWLMMELNGAYTFALFFPEFKQSAHLRKEISKLILSEMRKQVLPDGWQNELTPGYHSLVFSCGATFLKKAQNEGHSSEVPPELLDLLEDMADAHLAMMSPDFTQPLTNDSARGSSTGLFAEAYRLFPHRQDFLWASTKGRKGKAPAGKTASRYLPWGGFAVMRSNWKRNALYLSFDVGELGMAH